MIELDKKIVQLQATIDREMAELRKFRKELKRMNDDNIIRVPSCDVTLAHLCIKLCYVHILLGDLHNVSASS